MTAILSCDRLCTVIGARLTSLLALDVMVNKMQTEYQQHLQFLLNRYRLLTMVDITNPSYKEDLI